MVGKVEETLDPVQGHFGLKEAIDHPREVVEGKNEHAHQCQGGEHLSGVRGWGCLGDSWNRVKGEKTHSGPKHQKLRVYTTFWCFLQVKKITFPLFP